MCVDAKRIVVGFSGGAEFYDAITFASSNAITGFSGHVHHGLRAEEADKR